MTDYSQLTDTEIDTAMAGMMGWTCSIGTYYNHWEDNTSTFVCQKRDWHPHNDLNQVWKCEEKIIEFGLVEEYSRILYTSVSAIPGKTIVFNMLHSTARQRCEAMLMAMEGVK